MTDVARELWGTRLPKDEVVRRLTEAATMANVLDQVHIISHGVDLDGPRLIAEGTTNRQIIEMIGAGQQVAALTQGLASSPHRAIG